MCKRFILLVLLALAVLVFVPSNVRSEESISRPAHHDSAGQKDSTVGSKSLSEKVKAAREVVEAGGESKEWVKRWLEKGMGKDAEKDDNETETTEGVRK